MFIFGDKRENQFRTRGRGGILLLELLRICETDETFLEIFKNCKKKTTKLHTKKKNTRLQ